MFSRTSKAKSFPCQIEDVLMAGAGEPPLLGSSVLHVVLRVLNPKQHTI